MGLLYRSVFCEYSNRYFFVTTNAATGYIKFKAIISVKGDPSSSKLEILVSTVATHVMLVSTRTYPHTHTRAHSHTHLCSIHKGIHCVCINNTLTDVFAGLFQSNRLMAEHITSDLCDLVGLLMIKCAVCFFIFACLLPLFCSLCLSHIICLH